ncbi:MAG: helix-turn-helix domain-containing protein [Thermodesulfobacteriota bacterium]
MFIRDQLHVNFGFKTDRIVLADDFDFQYGLRKHIEREAIDALIQYHFPGNIRELQNIIESIIVLSPGDSITIKDLPPDVRHGRRWPVLIDDKKTRSLWRLMSEVSTEHIVEAVGKCGSQRKAAKHLGIHQSTISRRLKKRSAN